MEQSILIPKGAREAHLERLGRVLKALPADRAWRVEIAPHKAVRSLAQNRLLWNLYGQIISKGGEAMAGWTKEDLHTFFLGNFHGWEKARIFGMTKMRPLGRSRNLSKQDFADYVQSIVGFMEDRGVWLDMPEGGW